MKQVCLYLLFIFFLVNNAYSSEEYKGKITVFQDLKNAQEYTIDLTALELTNYSFHFLIPTIGRKLIFRLLDSLESQLQKQDFITIIFDAKDVDNIMEALKKYAKSLPCKVNIIFEQENLGFCGHAIRNKYANLLEGDFVLHCDDDNTYQPNALSVMRRICQDKNKLYIFKVKMMGENPRILWRDPKIYNGNIDTGSGVIPRRYNGLGFWQLYYGGNRLFYEEICSKIDSKDVLFVDYLIYNLLTYENRPDFVPKQN